MTYQGQVGGRQAHSHVVQLRIEVLANPPLLFLREAECEDGAAK